MTLDELLLTARTVWQEARGETWEGKVAVVHVIKNRAKQRNTDLAYEALRPWQFSGWNPGEVNRDKSRKVGVEDQTFRECIKAVLTAYDSNEDPTKGSRHYHAHYVNPTWARGHTPVVVIGSHKFYNTVN